MKRQAVREGGHQYRPVSQEVLQRRMELHDKPGQHLWMMTAAWAVSDPQGAATGAAGEQVMDSENLLSFGGPVCFKCEELWTRKRQAQRCPGSITEPMPWP
jgi:hypothetical protein